MLIPPFCPTTRLPLWLSAAFIPILLLVSSLGAPCRRQQQQGNSLPRMNWKIDVHRHLEDDQMKAMVPQFQIGQYELFYRDSVCFYNAVPKDEAPDPFDNQVTEAATISS